MRDDIKVDVVRGDSFRVRYTSEDPKTAQVVASKLASAYIEENLNDRGIAARNTTSFLKRELNEALIRLQQQEKRLEDYRRAYAGELPSQLAANQDGLGHARMQLRATTDQIASARDRQVLLDSEAADLLAQRAPAPLTGAPDSVSHEPNPRATIEQQLTTARATFAEQSARFTPDHPDYRAAARKVRELERDLARYNASVQPESATATVTGPTAVRPGDERKTEPHPPAAKRDCQPQSPDCGEPGGRSAAEGGNRRAPAPGRRQARRRVKPNWCS